MAHIADIKFAAIADALSCPTSCLPEMSMASYLEWVTEEETRKQVEHIAARVGLNPAGTNRLLEEATARAKALYLAHLLIEALIPHQDQIRLMLAPKVMAA